MIAQMADPASTLSSTRLTAIAGANYQNSLPMGLLGGYLKGLFGDDPEDGIIGQSSACASGSGFDTTKITCQTYDLSHTDLECDGNVIHDVGKLVNPACSTNGIGIAVIPDSGLVTTESGGSDIFEVLLSSPPTANVTMSLASSDTTEGTVSQASLTFTPANWFIPQVVTVTGVDDAILDGDVDYTIITAPAVSDDCRYDGLKAADVSVINLDDDSLTFTGNFSGSVVDEGVGGCPGTATLGGAASMTVTANSDGTFTYEGTVDLVQGAGICDDYSGFFFFSGTVNTLNGGSASFTVGELNCTGTLNTNQFSGTWSFSTSIGPDDGTGSFQLTAP